jgi:hypothetical protein
MRKNAAKRGEVNSGGAGENLTPELRSWIKNVIVPILVKEYVEERKRKNANKQPAHCLDSGAPNVRDCAQRQAATLGGLM